MRTQDRRDRIFSAMPDLGSRRRDLGKTVGILVMAVLMGLTGWVVASISTWLVPVYVTVMVLIFVAPRVHYLEGGERTGTEPEDCTDHAIRTYGSSSVSPSPETSAPLAIHSSNDLSALETELPDSVAKPRYFRGRGRKPARPPGTSPTLAPASAAWIQVAPGKFVRANSKDQRLDTTPASAARVEATETPTEVKGSRLEPLEEVILTTGSALADGPAGANLIEPEPGSDLAVPFDESGTVVNPQQDSPLSSLKQNATSGTGEYGIAPTAFGPNLWEAPLDETIRVQDQTGWSTPPRHVVETQDRIEPIPPMSWESSCSGNYKVTLEVAASGLPLAWTSTDEIMPAHDGFRSQCGWVRFEPGPCSHDIPSLSPRSCLRRYLRNGRSRSLCRSPTGLRTMAHRRSQAPARRNFGLSRRPHRRFQTRSPPSRS